MNLYEFILALSFWQWFGLLLLVGLPCGAIANLGPFVVTRNDSNSTWNTKS